MAVTSPYDGLTPEAIKAEMLADLQVKGVDVDHREGSYANTLVSVAAYQLYKSSISFSQACFPWHFRTRMLGNTSIRTQPSWA